MKFVLVYYDRILTTVWVSLRIWHPNIGEKGEVCLSLLRQNSYYSMGKSQNSFCKAINVCKSLIFANICKFALQLQSSHY